MNPMKELSAMRALFFWGHRNSPTKAPLEESGVDKSGVL